MKPICVKCELFYRVKKNGVRFEEGMPTTSEPGAPWEPYKLWVGDLWECRGCGDRIIVGVAPAPLAEHYQPDYAERVAREGSLFRVDDC